MHQSFSLGAFQSFSSLFRMHFVSIPCSCQLSTGTFSPSLFKFNNGANDFSCDLLSLVELRNALNIAFNSSVTVTYFENALQLVGFRIIRQVDEISSQIVKCLDKIKLSS